MNNTAHCPGAIKQHELSPLDPGILFPKLRFGIYRFTFKVQGRNNLSGHLGSAWRGMFCRILRRSVCLWTAERDCSQCHIANECLYYLLVEQKSSRQGYDSPPRPYVIRPAASSTGQVSVDLILVGQDDPSTLQSILSFKEIDRLGWAKKTTNLRLDQIFQMQPDRSWQRIFSETSSLCLRHTSWLLKDYLDQIAEYPQSWTICLATPIRLEKMKKHLQTIPWDWTFVRFANRLSMLEQHGRIEAENLFSNDENDELYLFFQNYGTVLDATLWQDMHRYSSRQKQKIPIGGLRGVGLVTPPAGREQVWYRWWQSAALLHLGKKTTIGHGNIEIN